MFSVAEWKGRREGGRERERGKMGERERERGREREGAGRVERERGPGKRERAGREPHR